MVSHATASRPKTIVTAEALPVRNRGLGHESVLLGECHSVGPPSIRHRHALDRTSVVYGRSLEFVHGVNGAVLRRFTAFAEHWPFEWKPLPFAMGEDVHWLCGGPTRSGLVRHLRVLGVVCGVILRSNGVDPLAPGHNNAMRFIVHNSCIKQKMCIFTQSIYNDVNVTLINFNNYYSI